MGYQKEMLINEMNEPCHCTINTPHSKGEHDACCQCCGENHTERICPEDHTPICECGIRLEERKDGSYYCVNPSHMEKKDST